jgi:hypothetical protein
LPRYFFYITHEEPGVDDFEGIDLPNREAAWNEATRACGEMMQDIDGQLAVGTEWQMEVHDEEGPLFRISFGAEKLR